MTEANASSIEKASDLGQTPAGIAKRWKLEIKLADKREAKWRQKVADIYKLYTPESPVANSFNILWTNTETLRQSVYNSQPQPDARRRYQDEDPLGKAVGEVLTRALEFSQDVYDEDAVLKGDVLAMLLAGRAVSRVCYVPDIKEAARTDTKTYEEIDWEQAMCERVQWDDFRILCAAKTWEQVTAIGFRHRFTREDCVDKFGDAIGNKISLDDVAADEIKRDKEVEDLFKTCVAWEIWDKDKKEVIWITESYPEPCKTQDDPLKFSGFFPIPRPLYAIENDSTLVPAALFTQYEQQAKELNRVSIRINKLVDGLKVRGIYDSTLNELSDLMKAGDYELIAAQNVTALLERGGLEAAIWMMPIETAAAVLKELYIQRDATKQVIYEITGISDIMRSASDPQETYGAQKIKTQWGTQRLQRMQREVQRYIRDLIRLKAEIISEKFQPETLEQMTLVELPHQKDVDAQYKLAMQQAVQAQQPIPPPPQVITWEAVIKAMRGDATRTYRVDIETDSTLSATQDSDMEGLQKLLGGMSQLIEGFGPAVQAGAIPVEAVKALLGVVARRAKMGTAVEDALDKIKMPQPGADPEQIKAQAAERQQQAQLQHEKELEQMRAQTTIQIERDKAQVQAQVDQNRQVVEAQQKQAEREGDAQLEQFKANLAAQQSAEQLAHDRELAAMQHQADEAKNQRDNAVKLQIAEMQRQTTLETAALSAQTAENTASLSAQTTEKTAALSADTEKHKAGLAADTTIKAAKESKKPAEPDTAVTDALSKLHEEVGAIKQHVTKPPAPRTPAKVIRGKDGKATAFEKDGEQIPVKRGPDGRISEV